MRIYKLEEASEKKARFIKSHPYLNDEQKEYLLKLYLKPEVPDNIINWQKIKDLSFDTLKDIAEDFLKGREEKRNKKNSSKAIEGRDYIKVFENTNSEGTEYLYLPLTWVGSKYLASDHFLPKIKVPSKVMDANDFSDNTAKNEDLSPGAKWCISLWTLPDLILDGKPFKTLEGKELRHEGKRYWLNYTSGGAYFLFYFRDNKRLKDISKKVALTLRQGFSKIVDITLANDTKGRKTPDIRKVQDYWDLHCHEYESQIEHIKEVSTEEYPKFDEYEKQKEEKAKEYLKSHIMDYLTYNESTGRYDSKEGISKDTLQYLVEDGEFTVPLGVINGYFICSSLGLKTLKNGPTGVTGNFFCFDNKLTTLEYAPQKVGGHFNCSWNKLKTLEYAPKEVGGYFDCSWNKLTTLEYAPNEVKGDFDCRNNNLITLEGAPNEIKGCFNCSYNNLTTLEGAPKYIGGNFDCSSNQLKTLEYTPNEIGWNFFCNRNNLTTLKGAPEKVKGHFNCSDNNLTTLEYSPKKVGEDFECYNNYLTSLEGAPEYVRGNFSCWNNPLLSRELPTKVGGRVYY